MLLRDCYGAPEYLDFGSFSFRKVIGPCPARCIIPLFSRGCRKSEIRVAILQMPFRAAGSADAICCWPVIPCACMNAGK